jgi:cytochrome b561
VPANFGKVALFKRAAHSPDEHPMQPFVTAVALSQQDRLVRTLTSGVKQPGLWMVGTVRMTAERDAIPDSKITSGVPDKLVFTPGTATDLGQPEPASSRPRKIVVLHWLTVLCLCFAAALILTREEISGRALRQWLLEGHRHFGLFVLVLFFIRVVVRIRAGKLPSEGKLPWALRAAAALTHIALYALLLSLPLLGWALSNAQDKPVHLFGLTLPALVGADDDLADTLQTWHVDAAWVLLALVLMHIAAALWHHFVLRDNTLRRMLPQRKSR